MPWRLRNSITMSRKSMLSSWSWSRSRTSGLTFERSSSGAMSAMMSRTAFLHSSLVMWGSASLLCHESLHNQRGIYPKHSERVVQDCVNSAGLDGGVEDEAGDGARRIEVVDVDCGMNHKVVKGRKIASEFQSPRGTHAVPDEALRVVNMRVGATFSENGADRLAFLDVAEGRRRCVGVHNVDVGRLQAGIGER